MIKIVFLAITMAAIASATSTTIPKFGRSTLNDVLFGIRGGGLFGKDDDDVAVSDATSTAKKTYPAMTKEEIEEWMAHIPVFTITNADGNGVVLKPDNDTSVSYFFMTPQMANATLQTMKGSNVDMDLKIAVMSLGKIWFNLIDGENVAEVKLKRPGSEESETTNEVEYRLVPDTRDLMGARMLLTMDPEDGEKMKQGGSISPEDAQKAIQKAMTESPKFKATYNEIPVFMIAQMRIQNQGKPDDAPLLPMYFSLQRMVGTWQHFASQDPQAKNVEPAINLMDLKELVQKMQEESEIDFRNVLLEPQIAMAANGELPEDAEAAAAAAAAPEPDLAQMGGETLGDL